MKTTLTGFFDHEDTQSIEAQINFIKSRNFDTLSLRKINGKTFDQLSDKEIIDCFNLIKKHKIKIAIIDPSFDSYNLYDDMKHQEVIKSYTRLFNLTQKIKVGYIMIKLPIFDDILTEKETLDPMIKDYLKLSLQFHKKLMFQMSDNHKSSTYVYILKKYKSSGLTVCFNPVYLYLHKEPVITAYRLFKGSISAFRANDCYQDGTPSLLGYGKTEFVKISKKFIRDNFSGMLIVDNLFYCQVQLNSEQEKPSFFKRIFSNKQKKQDLYMQDLKRKIFPKDQLNEKNVTYDDIIDNQIKVLEVIFK